MSDLCTRVIVDKERIKMNKIQITFANGQVLVTEEKFLNGYTLKGIRSNNPIILVSKKVNV